MIKMLIARLSSVTSQDSNVVVFIDNSKRTSFDAVKFDTSFDRFADISVNHCLCLPP